MPSLAILGPNLTEFGSISTEGQMAARNLPNLGQSERAIPKQTDAGQIWQTSPQCGRCRAISGRTRPKPGRRRPKLAPWPNSTRRRTNSFRTRRWAVSKNCASEGGSTQGDLLHASNLVLQAHFAPLPDVGPLSPTAVMEGRHQRRMFMPVASTLAEYRRPESLTALRRPKSPRTKPAAGQTQPK